MQHPNDLPKFSPWIESALVLVLQMVLVLTLVLQVALWTICVSAVVDLVAYLRGQ